MVVFSLLLIVSGQLLANAFMACCLGGAVMQTAASEAAPQMEMAHHHHAEALPSAKAAVDKVTVDKVAVDGAASRMLPPVFASLLDCAQSCAHSVLPAAALAPQAPAVFPLASPGIALALPQTTPSLPFRPPAHAA